MTVAEKRNALEASLTTNLNVSSWDDIIFGILPEDDPKGFLQLMSLRSISKSLNEYTWGIAIAASGRTRDELDLVISDMLGAIVDNYNNPVGCIPNLGRIDIEGDIEVDNYRSYASENSITAINGMFTSITFMLKSTS